MCIPSPRKAKGKRWSFKMAVVSAASFSALRTEPRLAFGSAGGARTVVCAAMAGSRRIAMHTPVASQA